MSEKWTFEYIPHATANTNEVRRQPAPGETNAYGLVKRDGANVICTHGGSTWLCKSCADRIWEEENRETGINRYFRELQEKAAPAEEVV
jgi:hypothetical protein